jgi:hypothetical protein
MKATLELLPGISAATAGFPGITARSVTRVGDKVTLTIIDTTPGDRCRMLSGPKHPHTGSTPMFGWLHVDRCELTQTLLHGVGTGRCTGGRP